MTESRIARCRCGQLSVTCTGDPVRVSVCHCHDCQRRSGSAFAAQARFNADQVAISGEYNTYHSVADSGGVTLSQFCPVCGSTLWYRCAYDVGVMAVAVGAFADSDFPAPKFSGCEKRKHAWVAISGDDVEHFD